MIHFLDPRSWSIRWRLTALNVGVLALTLALLGGVSLLQLETALVGITADYLRDQARLAGPGPGGDQLGPGGKPSEGRGFGPQGKPEGAGQPFGPGIGSEKPNFGQGAPPGGAPTPEQAQQRAATGLVRRLSGPDTGVLVFDRTGGLLASTVVDSDVEAWPRPSEEQIQQTLRGIETSSVVPQETRRSLVLLMPLRTPDGEIVGVLTLARSLDLTESVVARLRTILILGTVLALLMATALSLRATRSALRPLEQVIQAARRIGAGRLDERLRLARRDEIGELAEAFDSMLDRLAALVMAQRRFVADAAHELRTPLTALGGMIDMLEIGAHRGDPVRIRKILDTMNHEVQRLGRLVADLLTLSRLDADQPLRSAAVEIGPLVSAVVQQTRLIAKGQQIEERIEASPLVWGDADRLKQVLINLASNAIAHTPPGGTITFEAGTRHGHAVLAVSDTGHGIAPDLLPRVMDRFARGDDSRARSTGGAGLGLAIVQSIVEAHGGTISLESKVGNGTRVTVELPAYRPPARDVPHEPPVRQQAATA